MKVDTQLIFSNDLNLESLRTIDSESTVIFLFAGANYRYLNEIQLKLKKSYPKSKIIGCSSAGEIYHDKSVDDSSSIAICQFEKTNVIQRSVNLDDFKDSYLAGESLGLSFPKAGMKAIFLLSEGLNINASQFIKGLNSIHFENVHISGGLAGDGANFKNTWILDNEGQKKRCVSAIGLYGEDLIVTEGIGSGWKKFGLDRISN